MKYIVAASHNFTNITAYCKYDDEVDCTGDSGNGGGNYVDVEVGV